MTNDRHEVIIGGTGGQGVITIGYALAGAAAEAYQYVSRFPIYMATMRGGPAYCTVIFANQEVPAQILSRAKNTIAMEGGSYARLKKETKPGGRLFVNSSIVKKLDPDPDYKVYEVPVTDLAKDMGAPGMANMIMLGAYRTVTGIMNDEQILKAVEKDLAGEGSEGRKDKLRTAYDIGVNYAKEKLGE